MTCFGNKVTKSGGSYATGYGWNHLLSTFIAQIFCYPNFCRQKNFKLMSKKN